MDPIHIIYALIPLTIVQVYFQVYTINHILGNEKFTKTRRTILTICVLFFNNIIMIPYLLNLSRNDEYKLEDTFIYFRRSIIVLITLVLQILLAQYFFISGEEPYTLMLLLTVIAYTLIVSLEVLITYKKDVLLLLISFVLYALVLSLELVELSTAMQIITIIAFIQILNISKDNLLNKTIIVMLSVYFVFMMIKASMLFENLNSDEAVIYIFTTTIFTAVILFSFTTLKKQRTQNILLQDLNFQLEQKSKMIEVLTAKEERMRIAADIHDHVGHTLTTAIIQLESLYNRIENQDMKEKVLLANTQVKTGLNQIRVLVRGVDINFDKSFNENILELIHSSEQNTGLKVHYDIDEKLELVPLQQKVLLSAFKEFMTNAVKHGEAKEVNVLITKNKNVLEVTFSNDGKIEEDVNYGFGLSQMERSIQSIGGVMNVSASNHLGFITYFKIPLGGTDNE